MDKLTRRLRADAEKIEVSISDELDRRIDASLQAVTPEVSTSAPAPRPPLFWWASAVTGAAAALAVIAVVNRQVPDEPAATPAPVAAAEQMPMIDLHAEAAMLTQPLEQELEDLQSDLKKAEEKVRRDIGF
jgi:hypothetical protein